jgi:hypothetical protein
VMIEGCLIAFARIGLGTTRPMTTHQVSRALAQSWQYRTVA